MPGRIRTREGVDLKIVTWNIRYGIEVERAGHELARSPELIDADIILLQEMDEGGTAAIADRLGANFVYAEASVHTSTGRSFGNAIVSRWPLSTAGVVDLPHTARIRGESRNAVRAVADVDGSPVTAYSVHAEVATLRLARRVEQFGRVAADANAQSPGPIVIGGDFNTVTRRGVAALTSEMAAARLRPASEAAPDSFARFGRTVPTDHLFCGELSPVACGVVAHAGASDHRPLWAELAFV